MLSFSGMAGRLDGEILSPAKSLNVDSPSDGVGRWRTVASDATVDLSWSFLPGGCGGAARTLPRSDFLLFDGELNHQAELAGALSLRAVPESPDDFGLVRHALERWGPDALSHLHGRFCLLWWNACRQELLLGTSRTSRVLFYAEHESRLYFANELRALLALPGVPRRVDRDALITARLFAHYHTHQTGLANIRNLLPAHVLTWRAGRSVVNRYWRVFPLTTIRHARDEEYLDHARYLLERAVQAALPREGAIVSELSGGLDSTAVTATAARLMNDSSVHSITLLPDPAGPMPQLLARRFFDEWPYAEAVVRRYGNIAAHRVVGDDLDFPSALRNQFLTIGRPPPNLLGDAWSRRGESLARELGARTFLTGVSGNCSLSYDVSATPLLANPADYHAVLSDAFFRLRQGLGWRNACRSLSAAIPATLRWSKWNRRTRVPPWQVGHGLRAEVTASVDFARLWRPWNHRESGVPYDMWPQLSFAERATNGVAIYNQRRFATGMEARDPLGDPELVRFCLGLPRDQYVRQGVTRSFARRLLVDRLPAQICDEQRRGRQHAEWFHALTRQRPWLRAQVAAVEASASASDVVDVQRLRRIFDSWPGNADVAEKRRGEFIGVLVHGIALGLFILWVEHGDGYADPQLAAAP